MSNPVRIAHIGVSYPHGIGYIESMLLMPAVQIVALYDPDLESSKAMLPAELKSVRLHDDLDKLFEETHPEAVVITQPNDITPSIIVQAASKGIHVFAEKPCARTAAEFIPAIEAIKKNGVQFSTGYTRRVSPAGMAIKDIIDQGILGRLISIEASWITTSVQSRDPDHPMFSSERNGGGILHWLGCHWLDFMRWSTSTDVQEVAAILDTLSKQAIDVEDTAALSMRFDNGMIGTLNCSYVIDRMPHQLMFGLRGTDGWLNWDYMCSKVHLRRAKADWASGMEQTLVFNTDEVGGYEMGDGVAVLKRFISAFRENRPPAVSTDDVLRVLEVIEAAHQSSDLGQRVNTLKSSMPDY